MTLWRVAFLCTAIVSGMILLQMVWVSSWGGWRAINGWVMRITNASGDARTTAWVEFLAMLGVLVTAAFFSWHQQSHRAAVPSVRHPDRRTKTHRSKPLVIRERHI